MQRKNDFGQIQAEYAQLKKKMAEGRAQSIYDHKDEISKIIRDGIVTRYYYERGRVEASLAADPSVIKAKETLDNESLYKGILAGTLKTGTEVKALK